MNWIPPIFEPFNPIMAALLVAWFLAVSLTVHRATRFVIQRRFNRRWPAMIDATENWLGASPAQIPPADPLIGRLCRAARQNTGILALERFHEEAIVPLQEPDRCNDRWLQGLIQVAPLIGLVGTAAGILVGFLDLAAAKGVVTLRELAGPVSSALMTTVHGALCAAFCILVRTALSTTDQHRETDRWVRLTWNTVGPLLHKQTASTTRPAPKAVRLKAVPERTTHNPPESGGNNNAKPQPVDPAGPGTGD